jgi:putative restriction endonuclease
MDVPQKRQKQNWTREELILAFNLYCRTPFGRIHKRNPEILQLASEIGRTPSAVSWKLANFARLDPTLSQRSIKGASHGSKEDIKIWNEFQSDWEQLAFESQALASKLKDLHVEDKTLDFPEGKSKEAWVRVRLNQSFFRTAVLAAYQTACCITGIDLPELLCASHIVPWSVDVRNRTNPQNGLCLNAIHDRAFDRGLITVTDDYTVRISRQLKKHGGSSIRILTDFDGATIQLPSHFLPAPEFLQYHQQHIFQG